MLFRLGPEVGELPAKPAGSTEELLTALPDMRRFAGSLARMAKGCRVNPHGFSRGTMIAPKLIGNRFNGLSACLRGKSDIYRVHLARMSDSCPLDLLDMKPNIR